MRGAARLLRVDRIDLIEWRCWGRWRMLSLCWRMAALLTIGILLLFYEVLDKFVILYYLVLCKP